MYSNSENLSLLISAGALLGSLLAVAVTTRTAWQLHYRQKIFLKNQAQDAAFQRIHELLVAPKAAAGRRRLFVCSQNGSYPSVGDEGWDEINYALALYDTLGNYVKKDFVDEEIVLAAWQDPLQLISGPLDEFMLHRKKEGVEQPWEFLQDLIDRVKIGS